MKRGEWGGSRAAPLRAAHRGYEYQDIMAAIKLPDLLLGSLASLTAEKKLYPGDPFDDLIAEAPDGRRDRIQIKHREEDLDVDLPLSTFTTNQRRLRLDMLVAASRQERMMATPDRPSTLRVLLRDHPPADSRLTRILRPADPDPGPFATGVRTVRFRFDANAVWEWGQRPDAPGALAFIRDSESAKADIETLSDLLVIELAAPEASFDLTQPKAAERLLLDRVRLEIGAECYPNAERSAIDVAAHFVAFARAMRLRDEAATPDELRRQANLRSDYGAVARANPVNTTLEVTRAGVVRDLIAAAERAAAGASPLVVVAAPGHGKSWISKQLCQALMESGWLVAEHYCFLDQQDHEREQRVQSDPMFGSLLRGIAEADPNLVAEQRPLYAVNEDTLVAAVRRGVEEHGRVALVVDGLDHVTRVVGATVGRSDPAHLRAEELAHLQLPEGATVVVLSQPGQHLNPLEKFGGHAVELPGFSPPELRELAERVGAIEAIESEGLGSQVGDFVNSLCEKSHGNGLYATYICRELLKRPEALMDPAEMVDTLPPFDGSLRAYYTHLLSAVDSGGRQLGDLLAFLPFSVTRAEIGEIRPTLAHRVDVVLDQLVPVLHEVASQGGVRVYHESFVRFLRESILDDPQARLAILAEIVDWLDGRGFLMDARSFRYLLPTLVEAGRYADVVSRVQVNYVSRAVAAGFTARSIVANLATAVNAAAKIGAWPDIIRFVELARAAETYEFERLDSTMVEFLDIPLALLGPSVFVSRLLYDGRTTVPARTGLLLCDQVDAAGESAPWREYLTSFEVEKKSDNTVYGSGSNQLIELATLRGQLRLAENVDLAGLARKLQSAELPSSGVVDAVSNTLGPDAMETVIRHLPDRAEYELAMAERSGDESVSASIRWAKAAVASGLPPGRVHRLLSLGLSVDEIDQSDPDQRRSRLFELTRTIQDSGIQFDPGPILGWLDSCAVAARRDPLALDAVESILDADGWYGSWLQFAVALCRAEVVVVDEQPQAALEALTLLTAVTDPFAGDPRACDLFATGGIIRSTLQRALQLVDDASWREAIDLLRTTSNQTTVTLQGELGGPIPPDEVLGLVIAGTTSSRFNESRKVVRSILTKETERRFYTDVARFQLAAARLALAADDRDEAQILWERACEALVGYGVRKDATIYELLDPFPDLIELDRAQARERLPGLQELCERVVLHTDRKGTRGAPQRWWKLLAKADPIAVAEMAAPELLASCNLPSYRLTTAIKDLWKEQQSNAPPHIAAALRLAIRPGLTALDATCLNRLIEPVGPSTAVSIDWFRLVLSRVDERPTSYAVTDSQELVDRDSEQVDELNRIASLVGQCHVLPCATSRTVESSSASSDLETATRSKNPHLEVLDDFGTGPAGIRRAIRTWKRRPYRASAPEWSRERFTNALGYRLLELSLQDRDADCVTAIRYLANNAGVDQTGRLLSDLARGFELHGNAQLATLCHTLAWTRTRGGGGWNTFGGMDALESLGSAVKIDERATLATLAEEVAFFVRSSGYGTYGISRALVVAMSRIRWSSLDKMLPFVVWDRAYEVIRNRLPRQGSDDDPVPAYQPDAIERPAFEGRVASSPGGEGDSEAAACALTMGLVAGLSSPAREDKRRTLLAIKLLLAEEPDLIGLALRKLLHQISDPTTLTWLLYVLLYSESSTQTVVTSCEPALRKLALSRSFLIVRSLAAELLALHGFDPPPPPVADDGVTLGSTEYSGLWIPAEGTDFGRSSTSSARDNADANAGTEGSYDPELIVTHFGGDRVAQADTLVPGFRATVERELAQALRSESFEQRRGRQIRALASHVRKIQPNAVIGVEERFERIVQRTGAAARASLARSGEILVSPLEWEAQLARQLILSPTTSLALEFVRIPRPSLSPPPSAISAVWGRIGASVTNSGTEVGDDGLSGAEEAGHGRLSATVRLASCKRAPTVIEGPYRGWRVMASYETRETVHDDWNLPQSFTRRACALEARGRDDVTGVNYPPLAKGDARRWSTVVRNVPADVRYPDGPLVGIDQESSVLRIGGEQLGPADPLLAPTRQLVAAAELEPEEELVMNDADGQGLVVQTWRSSYDVDDYQLERPLLWGSWMLLSPSAFQRLRTAYANRLVWREFVSGTRINQND